MSGRFVFKRGDTFRLAGRAKVNGAIEDMDGWNIQAQVREHRPAGPGELIATLSGSWINAAEGTLQVAHNDTANWALGDALIDIRLTSPGGDKVTTSTVRFRIEEAVTRV